MNKLNKKTIICYLCNQPGHYANKQPMRKSKLNKNAHNLFVGSLTCNVAEVYKQVGEDFEFVPPETLLDEGFYKDEMEINGAEEEKEA